MRDPSSRFRPDWRHLVLVAVLCMVPLTLWFTGSSRQEHAPIGAPEAARDLPLLSPAQVEEIKSGWQSRVEASLPLKARLLGRTVFDSVDGSPAPGITIQLLEAGRLVREGEEESVCGEAVSGESGEFSFETELAGEYWALCEVPDRRAVLMPLDSEQENVIVLVEEYATTWITGHAVTTDGKALQSYEVTTSADGTKSASRDERLSSGDTFGVPVYQERDEVEISVGITAPGYRRAGVLTNIRRGMTHDVGTIFLEPLVQAVRGVVLDAESGAPIPDARILPLGAMISRTGRESWGHESPTSTDENGRFSVDSIRGERIAALEISAAGFAVHRERISWADLDADNVTILLLKSENISGRVVGLAGASAEHLTIRCIPRGWRAANEDMSFYPLFGQSAMTNADGVFALGPLEPGDYRVDILRAYREGDGDAASRVKFLHLEQGDAPVIELQTGGGGDVLVDIKGPKEYMEGSGYAFGMLESIQGDLKATSIRKRGFLPLVFLDIPKGQYVLRAFPSRNPDFFGKAAVSVNFGEVTASTVDITKAYRDFKAR